MPVECKIGVEVNAKVVLGKPIIRGTSRYPARARSGASRCQLVEQRLGVLQIERIEAFGEPAIDRSEQFTGFIPLALIAPEPRHAHRRAQLQGLCLLSTSDLKRSREEGLRPGRTSFISDWPGM